MKSLKKIMALILLAALCAALGGCAPSEPGSRISTPSVLISEAPGSLVFSAGGCTIDYSNCAEGYIMANYSGSNSKVKLQVSIRGGSTYTYDIVKRGEYETFPLSMGSGTYTVAMYENISGTKYSLAAGGEIYAEISDETRPFLYPSQYVSYNPRSSVVSISEELAFPCSTDLEVVERVFDYVTGKIDYDYSLASELTGVTGAGYLPNLENILSEKTGICFDYASLMAALLRCQRIPTKVVIGYAGSVYHAWISVYVDDIGWVNGIIKFDGSQWTRMDPTYASTGSIDEMVNDAAYNAMYYY